SVWKTQQNCPGFAQEEIFHTSTGKHVAQLLCLAILKCGHNLTRTEVACHTTGDNPPSARRSGKGHRPRQVCKSAKKHSAAAPAKGGELLLQIPRSKLFAPARSSQRGGS